MGRAAVQDRMDDGGEEDPQAADDADGANPRVVARLMDYSGVHFGHSAALGADGRIYVAGRWYRDGEGGGLGWYDPATGKAGGFSQPFRNYQVVDMIPIREGRRLVLSTVAVRDRVDGRPMPEQGRVFVYDVAAGALTRKFEPFPGHRSTGVIAPAGADRVLGLTAAADGETWLLYGFDVESGQLAFRKPLPAPAGAKGQELLTRSSQAFCPGPDGHVWFFVAGTLLRADPKNGHVTVVGRTQGAARIAFADGDLYLSGGEELRRVRGAVAAPE